jgi:hypothetical protein
MLHHIELYVSDIKRSFQLWSRLLSSADADSGYSRGACERGEQQFSNRLREFLQSRNVVRLW